jgi:hypothetical protein
MRVISNAPIMEISGFDGYSNADSKGVKEKKEKSLKGTLTKLFSEDKKTERKSKEDRNGFFSKASRVDRKLTRQMNKKAKKNARPLITKKEKSGEDKFFYPLSKLFKKDGKWFKKERDGSTSEVEDKNVVTTKDSQGTTTSVDKTEIQKATGGGAVNWQMALMQGLQRVTEAQSKGYLPIAVDEEKVTITDGGAFLNDEVQDKDKPLEDVKKDEKNVLTKNQKYLVWGIGIVAVGIIGFALYKSYSKGNATN